METEEEGKGAWISEDMKEDFIKEFAKTEYEFKRRKTNERS